MTWICSQCGEKSTRYRQRCARDGHRIVEDLAGQVIGGRYRLRELIGVGGMDSAVWKAWQMGAERLVAVKILPPADDAAVKRFSRGARIAANLNHPNCLVIHDYGTAEDGKLYLVMELLNGQVLNDALTAEGMPVEDTLHIADQVLQALEQAHSERAVHRDLKPDNLFLCKKNDDPYHVKILDFGIAKYIEEDYDEVGGGDGKPSDGFEDLVTEQRQVCGTPQYMAPEQVVGARVDGRADLYALGCVLYRMLTGRLPFDGKTRYELYQKHLQEAPRPFFEVRPDLQFPERLELIVMKALAKRPQHRFQSAAEMRDALASVPVERNRAKRGQKPRVALKDTSPQNTTQPTMTGPGLGDPAFEAALAQAPLKPSFVAARAPEPEPIDQPTVVRGIPAMGDWEPDAPAVATETTDHDVLQPANPTVLPHGVWTLSRPSPHHVASPQPVAPVAERPPTASIKRPTTTSMPTGARMPTQGQARVPTPQSQQAAATHPDGVQRSLSQTPPGARPVSSLATPAMQAVPGGWPQPTGTQSMARQAPDYLGDAVLRHPASRSMLGTGTSAVPRSSETEPSSVSRMQDRERPRWFVPVMLGGAFLLGVGGVSLGMSLFGDDSTPDVAQGEQQAEPVAPERSVALQASGQGPAGLQASGSGANAAAAGEVANPGAVVVAEPAAQPLLAEVLIESEPAGAEVLRGDDVLGRTPHRVHLQAGQHAFTLRLAGHMSEPLVVDATPVEGAGALVKRVVLQAEAPSVPVAPEPELKPVVPVPQRIPAPRVEAPRTPTPVEPARTNPPVEPKPVVVTPPAEPRVVEPKPAEPEKKPREVRLLDELDTPATPQPKPKPKVNLLDEDDAPPAPKPKPQIKTLDEL